MIIKDMVFAICQTGQMAPRVMSYFLSIQSFLQQWFQKIQAESNVPMLPGSVVWWWIKEHGAPVPVYCLFCDQKKSDIGSKNRSSGWTKGWDYLDRDFTLFQWFLWWSLINIHRCSWDLPYLQDWDIHYHFFTFHIKLKTSINWTKYLCI